MKLLYLIVLTLVFNVLLSEQRVDSGTIDNWAVVVSTSRYWFNYRHLANALSIYNIVKKLGIPDSRIIFLNTLDILNDARNPLRGEMYNSDSTLTGINLVDDDLEIDFSGNEVNVELFSRLLTNRMSSSIPLSKRLLSTNNSNILIYMSGHGGDEFFKFHDAEELSAQLLGDIFYEMHLKQRYRSILLVLETCQAVTMTNHLMNIPNIITLSSSLKGENSYAYGTNKDLGVASVDRFTYSIDKFFRDKILSQRSDKYCSGLRQLSLKHLVNAMPPSFLYSTASVVQSRGNDEMEDRSLQDIKLLEYFSSGRHVEQSCSGTK